MKKTVITSTGNGLSSIFDRRFGRAGWYCVFNEENGSVEFIENKHSDAGHGAGTRAAEKMVEIGVEKILSGDFGPKAKELLDRFQIQMVILKEEDITVGEILERLKRAK